MSQNDGPGRTSLYVCVTCRAEGDDPEAPRAGRRLHEALAEALPPAGAVELVPVECLSVCRRPCTVGLAAPGKWTYVYGDFAPEAASVETILAAARLYAETTDGLIPWKLRPEAIRRGVVARVPPLAPTPLGDAA